MPRPAWMRPSEGPPVRTLLAPFVKAQRGRLTRMSVAAIFGGFAEAAILVLIARIAFALTSSGSSVTLNLGPLGSSKVSLNALIVAAGALVLIRVALQAVYTVLAARAMYKVVEDTRTSLVHLYLAAGWNLQAAEREGRLQELLTTYTNASAGAISSLTQGTINGFNLVALLVTALWVNPFASLAAAVAAVVIGALLRPLRAAVRRRSARSAGSNLDFATGITELSSTLQEVRIFGVEAPVAERLDALNRSNVRLSLQTAYASGSIAVLYQGAALLLMVGALGFAHAAGFSRLSSLGAIVLIMLRSLSYAQGLQGSIQSVYQTAPYVETLNNEEARYRDSAMVHGGEPVGTIGALEFVDVSFEYEPGVPVLRELSFDVPHGEIVGIVGPSGSGKSTLVQLLLRLREPTSGEVLVDGVDARRLSLDDWYGKVTFVPQDPHLFSGTVAENIRFFRPGIDTAAIERAARLAHVHDDIVKWPQGYDTVAGERGGQLSGGQRQRVCIARALVESPDIIVLDEPTSSLDVRSESLIRDTIGALAPHTTVFIIAHRISTLAICDRIMVILNGALEGFDEPSKLEASNPFYREALRLSGMR